MASDSGESTQARHAGKVQSHRDLDVYWKAHELVDAVYDLSACFPRWEDFGLRSQITRAAISVPSNIAEGSARGSSRDFANFLTTASASLAEVDSHLEIAKRRKYITAEVAAATYELAVVVGKMITKLRMAVLRRDRSATEYAIVPEVTTDRSPDEEPIGDDGPNHQSPITDH